MFKQLLLFSSVLALSSCAYILDQSIQDLTVVTPGAQDSVCYIYVDKLRYEAHPPQTIHISKSSKDMTADCLAPGNRRRKIIVQAGMSKHEALNVANGIIPGVTWDALSNSFYTYPDTITIDFTSAPLLPEPGPAHNNPDIKQPEEYKLEEFNPGLPRLNSDRYNETPVVQRRQTPGSDGLIPVPSYTDKAITGQAGGGKPADKGDLQSVINGLNGNMNPSGAPATPGTAKPAATAAPADNSIPHALEPIVSTPKTVAPAASTQTFGPSTSKTTTTTHKAGPPVPIYPGQ